MNFNTIFGNIHDMNFDKNMSDYRRDAQLSIKKRSLGSLYPDTLSLHIFRGRKNVVEIKGGFGKTICGILTYRSSENQENTGCGIRISHYYIVIDEKMSELQSDFYKDL